MRLPHLGFTLRRIWYGGKHGMGARRHILIALLVIYASGLAWGYLRLPWAAFRNGS